MSTKKPSTATSTRALQGTRQLTQEIPPYQGEYLDTDVWSTLANDGWDNSGLGNFISYETYFDLSGYELDDLTFIPTGVLVQDPGRFIASNATLDYEILDIVSQERLTPAEINAGLLAGGVPGMSNTSIDFTQIISGNYRLMIQNTTSAATDVLLTVDGGAFGSGEATAAAKVWVYRCVRTNGTKFTGNTLLIPAARFVMTGAVVKEEELPYIMRLKRSYEIATQG